MNEIAKIRRKKGLSQRELAARANVSFRGIQLLEQPKHNWRIETLVRVAAALGLPSRSIEYSVETALRIPANSVYDVSLRIIFDGFESWKVHLFDFVDSLRNGRDKALIEAAPAMQSTRKMLALLAAVTEALCFELSLSAPAWCSAMPVLEAPWFVAGIENLKATALVESPVWFRARGIFVLGNFLDRA